MKIAFYSLLFIFITGTAFAEEAVQPVKISAAKSLEWNRKEKTYTARENVIVVQGQISMQSDTLSAHYNDDNGMTNISTLEARDNVTIKSAPYTAYGDNAVYNVKTGNALLTGKNLRITTDKETLTAEDKIEFFGTDNRLVALGNATATRGTDKLTANSLTAYFDKAADGKMALNKITAEKNVTIKTVKETITGDRGIYDIPAQKAVLTGKVRIRQGENWLEGTRANIDMATGISQLLGSSEAGDKGRVKGVFYPRTLKQKTESQ